MDILQQLQIQPVNAGAAAGGHWLSCGGRTLASINPANKQLLAKVECADDDAYRTIIAGAARAATTWRKVPAPKRGEIVAELGQLLRRYKDPLGSLIALEMGKIKAEGDGEIQEAIDMADFAVGQSRMLYGKTMHSERPYHRMYEQWHPLGVVGVVSAFNFPVAVWAWNAMIAVMTGNTVVWKPSSKTPLCAIAVQHLCQTVMAKHSVENIFSLFVSPGKALGETFINDRRIALISFTGSCSTGEHVATTIASRMGKSLLELGGNNAIVVDESADLKLAVPAIVFGAVGTAGQRCTSTRRLIVHDSILEPLMQSLCHAYAQIPVGNPLDNRTLMGPLIDQHAVDAFRQTVTDITAAGGEIRSGGQALDSEGFFVQPTLVKADNSWPMVQRETFAPILYVMGYRQFDQALAMNNTVAQGLSSALFTRNLQHAEQFLSSLGSDCGIANVNIGTSGAEIGGAFGGEKTTGGGREAGSDAWQAYMRRQTNTINWSDELPLAQGIRFDLPPA